MLRARTVCVVLLLATAASAAPPLWGGTTERMTALRVKYDSAIRQASTKHGLNDPQLVHAVILAESAYNRFAVSNKGAQGLMQLMPATAQAYGVVDVFDPEDNIDGGVRFLKHLMKTYSGDKRKALAAYNAGQEAVKKYGGIPPYAETRTYVARVMATYRLAPPIRKTIIYEFTDSQGRKVLTNDPRLAGIKSEPTGSSNDPR